MTAPNCPKCGSANTEDLGNFGHCLEAECQYIWYFELVDLDVAEICDETGNGDIVWGKLWIDVTEARPE